MTGSRERLEQKQPSPLAFAMAQRSHRELNFGLAQWARIGGTSVEPFRPPSLGELRKTALSIDAILGGTTGTQMQDAPTVSISEGEHLSGSLPPLRDATSPSHQSFFLGSPERIQRTVDTAATMATERGIDPTRVFLEYPLYREVVRRTFTPDEMIASDLAAVEALTSEESTASLVAKVRADTAAQIVAEMGEMTDTRRDEVMMSLRSAQAQLPDETFRDTAEALRTQLRAQFFTNAGNTVRRFWGDEGISQLQPEVREAIESSSTLPSMTPPARAHPMEPDIPSQVVDIDEAWDQARNDSTIFSARSRYRDFLDDAALDPLLRETSGRISEYPDGANILGREADLMAAHGFALGQYDEEQIEAEIARRSYWNEVIVTYPQIAERGITTDLLIREEREIAEQREIARKIETEHQRAMQMQQDGRLRLPYFLDSLGLHDQSRVELREALKERLDQLYLDRNTTVGDLNDALFEELAREAERIIKAVDFRQTRLDNLSQGILPQSNRDVSSEATTE